MRCYRPLYSLQDLAGTGLARIERMTIGNRLARWGAIRISRRWGRSLPWIGAAFAVAAVGATVRRKGFFGGVMDSGLNAVPIVGAAKNVVEVVRGRDFFPDR